ncbi:MAG: hypothetical protein AAGB34_04710, partial [Planctomycetota bacterium]
RYAPEDRVHPIAMESLKRAKSSTDSYKVVGVSAWPVRALVERGHAKSAAVECNRLLKQAKAIEHPGSFAQALSLLFQGIFPGDLSMATTIVEALACDHDSITHWRHRRQIRDCLEVLYATDSKRTVRVLNRMKDEKLAVKLLAKVPERVGVLVSGPREFFSG